MHTNITGVTSRPKTNTFAHRHAVHPAAMPAIDMGQGLLTREDLRHLVAAMVD
ncbi:MAG TPA: hypothetical protein VMQ93_10535 [Novosphingobium sp.]|nr:hypothetical protein [Novosphingobium sp.]